MQITQAALVAFVTQVVSIVISFGVIDSTEKGVVIVAATAVVNAGFRAWSALATRTKIF